VAAASRADPGTSRIPGAGGTAKPRASKSNLGSRTVIVLAGFVVVAVGCFAAITARARRLKDGKVPR
jgi:hypothetical protein